MGVWVGLGAALIAVVAGAANAEPSVQIRHAVARVTVIPEDRPDVSVDLIKANRQFPVTITRTSGSVIVTGSLGWGASANCHGSLGRRYVTVMGGGEVAYDDMPQIVVRTPRAVSVSADGAVFGTVGRGSSLDLNSSGCGDWTVADQTGPLHLSVTGSGDVHAGSVGASDVHLAGSADAYLQTVRGGLTAAITGSGDLSAAVVEGPLHAHVAGSGDVKVRGGAVTDMQVAVAGSGNVRFGGTAQSLDAHVSGSGDVTAAKVTGPISKHISGSGDITVGR